MWSKLVFVFLGVCLGVIALALVSAGEIYEYQDSVDGVHLPPVDAIVCLAGGRNRIAQSADIWYRYWELAQRPVKGAGLSPVPVAPPVFFVSGMGAKSNWAVLSKQVRRGVLEVLKPENVVLETESTNTEENAAVFAHYAQERSWDRILLVTSPYHMRRAKMIFQRVLKEVKHPMQIETYSVYVEPFEPGAWRDSIHGVEVTLSEYLKFLIYRMAWHEAGSVIH